MDTILEFDIEAETWREVGHMTMARGEHAVSIVNFSDFAAWCNWDTARHYVLVFQFSLYHGDRDPPLYSLCLSWNIAAFYVTLSSISLQHIAGACRLSECFPPAPDCTAPHTPPAQERYIWSDRVWCFTEYCTEHISPQSANLHCIDRSHASWGLVRWLETKMLSWYRMPLFIDSTQLWLPVIVSRNPRLNHRIRSITK